MLLLDTCALIWLASGNKTLSEKTYDVIQNTPEVYVSAISAFEIGHKYQSGGLELPLDASLWYRRTLEQHSLLELPLDGELCLLSTRLPQHHRDPCDRFIIAAALRNRWPVVTADRKFEPYGVEVIS